jgi:hypothetical protein
MLFLNAIHLFLGEAEQKMRPSPESHSGPSIRGVREGTHPPFVLDSENTPGYAPVQMACVLKEAVGTGPELCRVWTTENLTSRHFGG